MDLAERIARRRSQRSEHRLVVDWDGLNPAVHLQEPVGREALIEALLEAIDPLFDETLPSNVYVWGPAGAGKSAIVTALMSTLEGELSPRQPIYTTTRGGSERLEIRFVYVDARRETSRFRIYRQTLAALRTESVPRRGVGTDELRAQLRAELATTDGVLIAVDHLDEPGTIGLEDLQDVFASFDDVAWIGVGRTPPDDLSAPVPNARIHVPRYSYELVDILTVRASRALSRNLDHDQARRLTEWAEGNAHDALAALYVAAVEADAAEANRIRSGDVERGTQAIPRGGAPIGRVLALSENERVVLRELLDLPAREEGSIDAVADEIAERSDLTSSTVKRLLYELAQIGVLDRVQVSVGSSVVGRNPSMVKPNFSTALFERLDDT